MTRGRTLSKGDVHLIVAGIFFAAFILVRFTDPEHYGLTLHPKSDKVWSMWRMIVAAGWLSIAAAVTSILKREAQSRSLSYAAASTTAVGLVATAAFFPEGSSVIALAGSLALYAATSGVLCVKVQRPIPAAILGALLFVVQVLVDGVAQFLNGTLSIH